MINILLYPVSMIPVVLIYFWIKKKVLKDEEHKLLEKKALIAGFQTVIPVIIISASFALILRFVLKMNRMIVCLQPFYITSLFLHSPRRYLRAS